MPHLLPAARPPGTPAGGQEVQLVATRVMNTDPIADMLTRIRNALVPGHDFTDMPASRLKVSLAETLKREGFIRDFEALQEGAKRILRIHLAYADKRAPVMSG